MYSLLFFFSFPLSSHHPLLFALSSLFIFVYCLPALPATIRGRCTCKKLINGSVKSQLQPLAARHTWVPLSCLLLPPPPPFPLPSPSLYEVHALPHSLSLPLLFSLCFLLALSFSFVWLFSCALTSGRRCIGRHSHQHQHQHTFIYGTNINPLQ